MRDGSLLSRTFSLSTAPCSQAKPSTAPAQNASTIHQRGQQQRNTAYLGLRGEGLFSLYFGRSGCSLCNLLWLRWMATGALVLGLAWWNGRRVEHDGCQVPSLQEHGVLPRRHSFSSCQLGAPIGVRLARSTIIVHAIPTPHNAFLSPGLPAFSRACTLTAYGSPFTASAGFAYLTPLFTNLLPIVLCSGSPVGCIQAQGC